MAQQLVAVREQDNVIGQRTNGETIPIWTKLVVCLAKGTTSLDPRSLGAISSHVQVQLPSKPVEGLQRNFVSVELMMSMAGDPFHLEWRE